MQTEQPNINPGKRLAIVDGHSFLWRSYAVPFKFSSSRGTPLQVVSTFLSLLRRAVSAIPHFGCDDCLLVVFDTETQGGNFVLYDGYKSNRTLNFEGTEDSPFHHLPFIRSALEWLGVATVEQAGVEADDIIASLSRRFTDGFSDSSCYIFSSDSDFYQLIDERIFLVTLKPRNQFDLIDKGFIERKLGIDPSDYVAFKALTGDRSDNIPGVPGVGPKTARAILLGEKEFDREPYKELLARNHKLIELDHECDCLPNFDQCIFEPLKLSRPNHVLFDACGF